MRSNRGRRAKTDLDRIWLGRKGQNVVGPKIRKLRNQRNLTQEQLAVQCQVRGLNLMRGTLAKIEARLRYVKACELFVIAKVLQVPMESFYPSDFGVRRGS